MNDDFDDYDYNDDEAIRYEFAQMMKWLCIVGFVGAIAAMVVL